MENRGKTILIYFTLVVVSLFFLFWGLAKAKSFLAPLSVAALLAMVVLPICKWFESKGLKRGWASLLSDLIILIFFVALAGVVGMQIKSIANRWPQIKERIEPKVAQLEKFVAEKTGLTVREVDQKVSEKIPGGSDGSSDGSKAKQSNNSKQNNSAQEKNQQQTDSAQTSSNSQGSSESQASSSSGSSMLSSAGSFITKFLSFLGTFLLIFVYIFFFLLYRNRFRVFILKLVPDEKRDSAKDIITKSTSIAQNYLFGRLILIMFLTLIYAAGLSISGVKHAIIISLLAALLSLVPYIGNIVGFFLAITMAFISGSGLMGALGVTITFAIAQFVESYILEPYIVGDKVNLNPIFTIIVVVLGGAVWGVIGMLIAIPALGIIKIVFNHIPALQPYAYLFGQEGMDSGNDDGDNFFTKTKKWALNKFK